MADTSWAWQACPVDASWGDYKGAFDDWIAANDRWQSAYTAASLAAQAASFFQALQQLAIAALQYKAAKYAADKQWDIANRQMKMAEEEHNRYKEHFWCVENLMADEACTEPLYTPDYQTRASRAVLDVRKQFGIARQMKNRMRQRYCIADFGHEMCDLLSMEAKAVADVKDKSYRYEEARRDAFDDRRFNRQLAVSQFGRNLASQSVALMAQGAQIAIGAINTQLAGTQQALGAASAAISGIISTAFTVPNYTGYNYSSPYVSNTSGFQPANSWTPVQGYEGGGISNMGGPAPMTGFY